MTTPTIPSSTKQKNNAQATMMLCANLAPQPDTNPLDAAEYHALRATLTDAGLSVGDLLRSTAGANEHLQKAGMTDQQMQRISRLIGRGFALSMKLDKWSRASITTNAWDDDDYPQALHKLGEIAPPLIHQCGNTELVTQPNCNVAVLTPVPASPRANNLIEPVAEQIASSGQTLVVSTNQPAGLSLLLKTIRKSGSAIALVGILPLYEAALSRIYREYLMAGRLLLISANDPDISHSPDRPEDDAILSALASRSLRLKTTGESSLESAPNDRKTS